MDTRKKVAWAVLYGSLSAAATIAARRAAARAWTILTGERPPAKGAGGETNGQIHVEWVPPEAARAAWPDAAPAERPSEKGNASPSAAEGFGATQPDEAPAPQPERHEPRLAEPGLGDLSRRDYVAVAKRAVKEAMDDQLPLIAGALAYSSFLAIPSALLVVVGLFTLVADAQAISDLMQHLVGVIPADAISLLNDSLQRLNDQPSTSIVMTIVGFVLAIWSTTGAMNALMSGLNIAYDRKETRSFVKKRSVALGMVVCMVVAFALIFGLLVLGPVISDWVGRQLSIEDPIDWIWWVAQWPLLVGGLLLVFAAVLYLGPNVDHPRWQFITPGSLAAVVIWLLASGLFAVYTSMFGSYNKAWGSLAAVIVMLVWLWLTSLAVLLGAEINAELERSRELRHGEPAEVQIQAPARA